VSRPPRNYLARDEQQRIFWRFMPPAIAFILIATWVEQTWFRKPAPPPPPQVDTRLVDPLADASVPDAVLIEQDPEPFVAEEGGMLAASPAALDRVRDDTVFREADRDAWFEIWKTLRDDGPPPSQAVRRVSFAELFGQPRSFRGRPVAIAGTLRRLERVDAPANDYGIDDYWQGWLEPEGGPASPVVVYFLDIPADMPTGLAIGERIDATGYFFKRWAYAAKDTVRLAPLVMAASPRWSPRPPARPAIDFVAALTTGTIFGVILVTLVGIWLASRGASPVAPPPADLEQALAGEEIVSTEEALRRLADNERSRESSS
jgi:hypothetical protein